VKEIHPRHCERSEAAQPDSPSNEDWIASSLALIAMVLTLLQAPPAATPMMDPCDASF
jgi:hypothetical protein